MKQEDKSQRPMKTSRKKFMAHRHTKYSESGERMGKIKTSLKAKRKSR